MSDLNENTLRDPPKDLEAERNLLLSTALS